MDNLNTFVKHTFADGSTVDCTITMSKVLALSNKNKDLHKLMGRLISKGSEDIFEMIRFVYGAYLCAHINEEDVLTESEFVDRCGDDYVGIGKTMRALVDPKK